MLPATFHHGPCPDVFTTGHPLHAWFSQSQDYRPIPISPSKSSLLGLIEQMRPPNRTPKETLRLTVAKESKSESRLPSASHTPGPRGFYLSGRSSMTAQLTGYRHSDLSQEKAWQRGCGGSQAPPSNWQLPHADHKGRLCPSSVPGSLQVFTLRMKGSVKM